MLVENSFEVAIPAADLWPVLLDVERVVPCLPGAELTEAIDERTWKGAVTVRFGPVSLSFAGTVEMIERDDAAMRVRLLAKGTERKGKGGASATVTTWLEPGDGATTVRTEADVALTGVVAQVSRGLIPEVARRIAGEFAQRLEAELSGGS